MKRKIQLYLHTNVLKSLTRFGDIKTVLMMILDEAAKGTFEITNLPKCPNRNDANHIDIMIEHPYLDELYATWGEGSKHISLRRLLYWFDANEMYYFLGWQTVSAGINPAKVNAIYDTIIMQASKLTKYGIDPMPILDVVERMKHNE